MKIPRFYSNLHDYIKPEKALIIYGPRQTGKTTLLLDFLSSTPSKYKFVTGDDLRTQEILGSQDFNLLNDYIAGYELLAIDEAQKISNIGVSLKILIDRHPGILIIATGSSSFELAGQIGEPLTGRKRTLTLYPVSQMELANIYNSFEIKEKLGEWLVFGGYPEVITSNNRKDKMRLLEDLVYSYLLKDILELDRVKNARILLDLLRLVSYQIGNEVSHHELAKQLHIDSKTVGRYLDLFEKSFILYNVRGYSRNLRTEISKKSKYYFYDNGIRNAIISNFNSLDTRNDIGKLWENFLFIERLKMRSYKELYANVYFWRTWEQQEIDIVEEREGTLLGYECKYSKEKVVVPSQWHKAYPDASYEVISKEDYLHFLL